MSFERGKPLSLKCTLRHASALSGETIEHISFRRPETMLTRTSYRKIIVDERRLSSVYPWNGTPDRITLLAVLEGTISFPSCELGPGDVALLRHHHQGLGIYGRTVYWNLDWRADASSLEQPTKLAPAPLAELEGVSDRFDDVDLDERALFERAIEIGRARGVTFDGLEPAKFSDGPSERDIRLCRALEAQLSAIGSRADANHVAELADLSPRQLQRVLGDFAARYGFASSSWREQRNRWRVQVAAVLLGLPAVTVAQVAEEVGYASAAALTRALATAGFPSPTELRRES